MFRGRFQTITIPLGSIELRKWLLRNKSFTVFLKKKVAFVIFFLFIRPASTPQVVITRILKQNPFLKDCFQNKAPSSNYCDIHVII